MKNPNKKFSTLNSQLLIIIVALALASCSSKEKTVAVTGVTLSQSTAVLSMLDNLTLIPVVTPADATNPSVSWSSSNEGVATVNNGVVTPVAYGSATITVTTTDGNKTAACAVTVNLIGQVSFKTSTIWTIPAANGAPKQEWSDVVMASGAKKDNYNGGSSGTYLADCRQNQTGYGDLFSWEAVNTYKDQLCPAPWRVPTVQDFINLDKALGGDGNNRNNSEFDTFITPKYLGLWGGAFGGLCSSGGTLNNQGSWAYYWSATEDNAACARNLNFDTGGLINPQNWSYKYYGFTLRCVRD